MLTTPPESNPTAAFTGRLADPKYLAELTAQGLPLRDADPSTWDPDEFSTEDEIVRHESCVRLGLWWVTPQACDRLMRTLSTEDLIELSTGLHDWMHNRELDPLDYQDPGGRLTAKDFRPGALQAWSDSGGNTGVFHGLMLGRSAGDRVDATSWQPIDIQALLAGGLEPVLPSQLVTRTDGVGLFYGEGRLHHVMGPPETLKSMMAQIATARTLLDGGRALYVVHDGDAADVVRHLLAFNVPPEVLAGRLTLLQPEEPLTGPLDIGKFDICVIDGVDDAMALHGLNPDKSVEYRRWLQLEVRPLQRATTGPLILIDHVAKNKEARDGWPVGTGAKRAAADVALSFDIVQDFGRGRTGVARITLAKDRPGGLRAHQGSGREIARLRLQSHYPEDEMLTWELLAPATTVDADSGEAGGWMPTGLMERVSRYLEQATAPVTRNVIETVIKGKRDYVRQAVDCLCQLGYAEVSDGANRSRLHRSIKPYREDPDPSDSGSPRVRPEFAPGEPDDVVPGSPPPALKGRGSPPSFGTPPGQRVRPQRGELTNPPPGGHQQMTSTWPERTSTPHPPTAALWMATR